MSTSIEIKLNYIEQKVKNLLKSVYNIKNFNRYKMHEENIIFYAFKYNDINYNLTMSIRNNNFGFSLYNKDDYEKMYENDFALDKTILNDNKYLYNIYMIIFRVLKI